MGDKIDGANQQAPYLGRGLQESFGNNLADTVLGYREFAMNVVAMLTAVGNCENKLNVYAHRQ